MAPDAGHGAVAARASRRACGAGHWLFRREPVHRLLPQHGRHHARRFPAAGIKSFSPLRHMAWRNDIPPSLFKENPGLGRFSFQRGVISRRVGRYGAGRPGRGCRRDHGCHPTAGAAVTSGATVATARRDRPDGAVPAWLPYGLKPGVAWSDGSSERCPDDRTGACCPGPASGWHRPDDPAACAATASPPKLATALPAAPAFGLPRTALAARARSTGAGATCARTGIAMAARAGAHAIGHVPGAERPDCLPAANGHSSARAA